jgi:hypothetical protein
MTIKETVLRRKDIVLNSRILRAFTYKTFSSILSYLNLSNPKYVLAAKRKEA